MDEYEEDRKYRSTYTRTPVLDTLIEDLSKQAEEGDLRPIVERKEELAYLIQHLGRQHKNNLLLIGESGVGKRALVEELALRILAKRTTPLLNGKRLVVLDPIALPGETHDELANCLKTILGELSHSRDVIVCMEGIHLLLGAMGTSLTNTAANMFKLALSRNEIQCIGTLTREEYTQYIEKDLILDRYFQKLFVDELTQEDTIMILEKIQGKYEDFHCVMYSPEVLTACVRLSSHYMTERSLPEKAIDILDEVAAYVQLKNVVVPRHIQELEANIEELREQKNRAVRNQQYEEAANLRNAEVKLSHKLEEAIVEWEDGSKRKRYPISAEDVYEIFMQKTGLDESALRNYTPVKVNKFEPRTD